MFWRKGARRAFENNDWAGFVEVYKEVKKHSIAQLYNKECEWFRYDWRARHTGRWWGATTKTNLEQYRNEIRKIIHALRLIKALVNNKDYEVVIAKHKTRGPGACSLLRETSSEILERECADKELAIKKKGRWG